MTIKRKIKFIHEGNHVAEVSVDVIEDETSWSPYISVADAMRLDDVRAALSKGDLRKAATIGKVYRLQPIAEAP